MYLLGLDIGSSSIKAALLDAQTQQLVASAFAPDQEMPMIAGQPGWAEQHPDLWWNNLKIAIGHLLTASNIDPADIAAIGISYQMHGLVIVDKNQKALRPSIIWCDSRAVEIGNEAAQAIGPAKCLKHLLNLPGNFTASKLSWVRENEPEIYDQIHKAMLPGDYIAMRLTDTIVTTESGLSEGILWDYQNNALADIVLNQYGIDPSLIPDIAPTFSVQGELSKTAAAELGLKSGVSVSYRAGDQPNNALSLNVLNTGEIATTA
ncbi:MAG: carbohydrate kinase, partial [Planctomycetes bacterium]|nr:carbohydrate kinase [Planctomycetota bacterium]